MSDGEMNECILTGRLLCVGTKLSSTSIIPLNSYDNHDIVSILWTRKVRSRVVE